MMQELPATNWLEIGKIVGAQGLQGDVKVYPSSDFPERFLVPGTRWIQRRTDRTPQPIELLYGREVPGKGLYVIELAGIESREAAETLRDAVLFVSADDRPELDEGEFHVADLIGLVVINHHQKVRVGVVEDVMTAGNDLLSVRLDNPLETDPITAPIIAPETTATSATDTAELFAQSQPDRPTPSQPSKKRRKPWKKKAKKAQTHIFIPFVEDLVPIVNLNDGFLEVVPVPGLLDTNSITIEQDTKPDVEAQ